MAGRVGRIVVNVIGYYAENGGIINGAIFLVAVFILYIGFGKLFEFRQTYKKIASGKDRTKESDCKFFDDVIFFNENHSSVYYKNLLRERLLEVIPRLESGLDTMATLIQVAPFLGLFGTVSGMIQTFSLITTYGTSNPIILTRGITVSLLTTQAGLLVAFPCMLFHNYLSVKKDGLIKAILLDGEHVVTKTEKKGGENYV